MPNEEYVFEGLCGTSEYHERKLRTDREYRDRFIRGQAEINELLDTNEDLAFRLSPAIIPVVVHVVWNTPAQNISDADIHTQIAALNRDYARANADLASAPPVFSALAADTGVRFQLATRDPNCNPTNGITRTETTVTQFSIFGSDDMKSAATGGADPWPADRYLNIWVCAGGSTEGGRATFPGEPAATDGVVVNYIVFGPGSMPGYTLGRVTVHEVGHYFSLFHTFQGGCSNLDQVTDTPAQAAANYGCPTFPHVSCSNGPNGDMFVNYMDYTQDSCKVMFTVGQAARLQAALTGPRSGLLASDGIVPVSGSSGDLWSADVPLDLGDEPDMVAAPMWISEDIWVRNLQDGIAVQDHQNPVHRPAGPPNYVYVRVRNRSCGGNANGRVKLYWAKASTGLSWRAPWDGSVTSPALMGGQIGDQNTGNIPGGGHAVLEFPWSPPNPADYASFGADQSHFCLLSRIETSPSPPYGMTSPETSDLYNNVRNNNNIVWKNIEVVTGSLDLDGSFTIGNFSDETKEIYLGVRPPLAFRDPKRPFAVVIEIGKELGERVRETDAFPDLLDDDGRVVIKDPRQRVGPITLEAGEHHTLRVRLVPPKGAQKVGVFTVDIIQFEGEGRKAAVVGGQRVAFKVRPRRKPRIRPELVGRKWWHAHEEDQATGQAFRPEGYDLPFSMGRWGVELRDDHTARVYDIAAADGVDEVDGYWWAQDEDRVLVSVAEPDRGDVLLELRSAADDKLVIDRHEARSR